MSSEQKKYEIESKYNGYLTVKDPNSSINREFPYCGFKMKLTKEELESISYVNGGRYILENYLIIKDPEIIKALQLNLEYEDSFTKEQLKDLLLNGTIENLQDTVNFAHEGTIMLLKDLALELEINDIRKIELIGKALGINIQSIKELDKESKEDGEIQKNSVDKEIRRVSEPFIPKTNSSAEKPQPEYKIVNGQRIRTNN